MRCEETNNACSEIAGSLTQRAAGYVTDVSSDWATVGTVSRDCLAWANLTAFKASVATLEYVWKYLLIYTANRSNIAKELKVA